MSFLSAISCPLLVTPPKAIKLTPSCASVYGSSCLYSCQNGYTSSSGNVTRTCLSSGQWSGNDINCTGNDTSWTACTGLIALLISRQETSNMVYMLPFSNVLVPFDFCCFFIFFCLFFLLLLLLTQWVCSNTKTESSLWRSGAGVGGATSTKQSNFQITLLLLFALLRFSGTIIRWIMPLEFVTIVCRERNFFSSGELDQSGCYWQLRINT